MKFSPPPSPEARQKALDLLAASKTTLDTGDEPESVDSFIAFHVARLVAFRQFALDYGLPAKADFFTWENLYRKEWENVDGEYLSAEEIVAFASGRDAPTS
jgi:hypothetical protein